MKRFLAVLVAGVWINISEFVRNELLLKSYWTEHYESLGLSFPGEAINGAVWGIWAYLFAIAIAALSRKFSFGGTFLWAWIMGFVMMWLVTGNMLVLPLSILPYAIPLSLLETGLALWLILKIDPVQKA